MGRIQFWGLFGALALSACGESIEPNANETSTPESIPTHLHPRVTLQEQALSLSSDSAKSDLGDRIKFKYLASVEAPKGSVSGEYLQATSFDFYQQFAVVTYAMVGDSAEGQVDLVYVKKGSWADIHASVSFENTEFGDVAVSGKYAYLVGASSGEHEGAVIVVMDVSSPKAFAEVGRVNLPGYYASSIAIEKSTAYIASGDNAGVIRVDISKPSAPKIVGEHALSGILSVVRANGETYSLSGKKGTHLFKGAKFENIAQFSLDPSFAPGRMVADDNLLITNADQSGLNIFSFRSDRIIAHEPLKGTGNGLDLYCELLFLAQGDAGLWVADISRPDRPDVMGHFDFPDDRGSANNVQIDKVNGTNTIFLADGLGGFRVIAFEN